MLLCNLAQDAVEFHRREFVGRAELVEEIKDVFPRLFQVALVFFYLDALAPRCNDVALAVPDRDFDNIALRWDEPGSCRVILRFQSKTHRRAGGDAESVWRPFEVELYGGGCAIGDHNADLTLAEARC